MDDINNYIKIILNYTIFFNKNIENINKNKLDVCKKLYLKGLNIIFIIYILSYKKLHTNELENICEKGQIYYIEFINQLNLYSVSENNFELTLKDVILFTYKKTIFNLNNENIIDKIINHKFKYILYIINKLIVIYYHDNNLDEIYINIFFNDIIKLVKILNELSLEYLIKIDKFIYDNDEDDKLKFIKKYIDKKEYI